ncbi:hypothetical protein MMC28_001031 [Mycoblastus sanguinarius]|nr:hypothetical protein [Mycoblastus sanguinarius]
MSRELLMPRLDYLATQEPHRAWASIPANDADLSQGFRDISYQKLMHTANNAASWVEKILGTANDHATFAYEGPRDLRHLILAIAARKLGKRVFDDFQPYSTQIANFVKILLMSSYSSIESRVRLMDAVQCDILLFADANDTTVRSILGERPSLQGLHVPSQIEWLDSENRDRHPYIKDWQIGKDDEWIIFHTSGTTGRPPITYFATEFLSFLTPGRKSKAYYLDPRNDVELSGFLEAAWGRQINSYIIQRPAAVTQMWALQTTAWLGAVYVQGSAHPSTVQEDLTNILHFGALDGIMVYPALLAELVSEPKVLEMLKRLCFVHTAGAALNREIGNKLCTHTEVAQVMGTTEAGLLLDKPCRGADWCYHDFYTEQGFVLEETTKGLFEVVYYRNERLRDYQQVFDVYPDQEVFRTNDVFAKHPSKPDLWLYMGRKDDFVMLSWGDGFSAHMVEAVIEQHPAIKSALVGGQVKSHPFVILELAKRPSEKREMVQ